MQCLNFFAGALFTVYACFKLHNLTEILCFDVITCSPFDKRNLQGFCHMQEVLNCSEMSHFKTKTVGSCKFTSVYFLFVALPKKSGPVPLTKIVLARHKSLQKYAESRGKRMMRTSLQNLGIGYEYSTEGNADLSSGKSFIHFINFNCFD